MNTLRLACFLSCILAVLGGGCLTDWNTGQPSSAWNQKLWSYNPSWTKSASTSSTLNIMTYNLQSSISNNCKSNPTQQAQLMTWADYCGHNEVTQGVDTRCNCVMEKIIADTTGFSTRFLMTFPWRTGQYGIGCGTSQTIIDTQYLMYNFAGAEQRGAIAIKTKPPGLNGRSLWFVTTHVEYTVAAARQAQVSQLLTWVKGSLISKDSDSAVIAVGDFNAGPWDPMYNNMKTLFKNAWEVYNGGIGGGNTYPADYPGTRFDHIWYYVPSGWTATPTYVEVVNSQNSDHRPLRATFRFTTPGGSPSTPAPSTPAPATQAPVKGATAAPVTPAPTVKPTTTPAPSTAAPSSSGSGTCTVSVSFNAAGNNIVVKNTGSKAVKSVSLKFTPSLPSNNWNLISTSTANTFTLPAYAYGSLAANGQTYTSSGYYTSGAQPTITVASVSC